ILVYIRRNSLDCQGPIGVLGIGPVESWPDLFPTMLTTPAGDAKERDVGGARPEGLEGLRTASKSLGFRFGDLVEKGIELSTLLGPRLTRAQRHGQKRGQATNHKDDSGPDVCPLHLSALFSLKSVR